MSILIKLDRKNFSNLPEILAVYETRMEGYEKNVGIDGKNIEGANVEQSAWLAYYDQIKVELKTLLDFMDMKVKEVRGERTHFIIKNAQIDHNQQTRERMIDCDPAYIHVQQYYLMVKESFNTANSIVEQLIQRGYTLRNLVEIRVAGVQDITLFINDDNR